VHSEIAGLELRVKEENYYENWESLTDEEWQEYAGLVDQFAIAKNEKNYFKSDQIKILLQAWQSCISDDEFIDMHEKGEYRWLSIFEQQGYNSHRHVRLQKRLNAEVKGASSE
jgi:hypothetical protein